MLNTHTTHSSLMSYDLCSMSIGDESSVVCSPVHYTSYFFLFYTRRGDFARWGHLSVERGAEVNLLTSLHPYPPLTLLTSFRRKLVMSRKAPPPRDPTQPTQPTQPPRGSESQQPETTMESPPPTLETQPSSTSAPNPSGVVTSARKRGGRFA